MELIREIDKSISQAEKNALTSQTPNIFSGGNLGEVKPMTSKEWKKKLEKLKEMQEKLDEQFAEMAERNREQLQENGDIDVAVENRAVEAKVVGNDSTPNQETQPLANKADDSTIDFEQLAPVVAEIASKVANNDVQLFEVKI